VSPAVLSQYDHHRNPVVVALSDDLL